jgi:GT2 family glycosyltransferase
MPPQPPDAPAISAVVPTIGRSPWLAACLEALRGQQGVPPVEILVVDQAPQPLALPPGLADRVLRPPRNLGFAGGTNLGLAAARGELVATVNDDALVAPDWLAHLAAALRADPGAAAAQGVNLVLDPLAAAATIDGCGLGWNRWWQAIQLGHGEPWTESPAASGASRTPLRQPGSDPSPPPASSSIPPAASSSLPPPASASVPPPPVSPSISQAIEVFGVSATAALFRRDALRSVARGGQVFEPLLVSYYEDAELAGRLRAAGFRALLVPLARARHAGSASGQAAASRDRWRLIYGNRYLAAARLLGRAFWPRLPAMVLRDLLDLRGLLRPAPAQHPVASGADVKPLPPARRYRREGGLGGPRPDLHPLGVADTTPASTVQPSGYAGAANRTSPAGGAGIDDPAAPATGAAEGASGNRSERTERRRRLAGMAAGWGRALRLFPAFVHLGRPVPPPAEVARLSRLPVHPE